MSDPATNTYNSQDPLTQELDEDNMGPFNSPPPSPRPVIRSYTQSISPSPLPSLPPESISTYTAPTSQELTSEGVFELINSQDNIDSAHSSHTEVISQTESISSQSQTQPIRSQESIAPTQQRPFTRSYTRVNSQPSLDSSVVLLSQKKDSLENKYNSKPTNNTDPVAERIDAIIKVRSRTYHLIKWKHYPEVFDTVEYPVEGLPLAENKEDELLVPANQEKLREMDRHLQQHTDRFAKFERDAFAKLWLKYHELDAYTCAFGIAVFHEVDWWVAVSDDSDYARALQAIEDLLPSFESFQDYLSVSRIKRKDSDELPEEEFEAELHQDDSIEEELSLAQLHLEEPEGEAPKSSLDYGVADPRRKLPKSNGKLFQYKFPDEDLTSKQGELLKIFETEVKEVNQLNNLTMNVAIIDLEVHDMTDAAEICQLCAVNLQGDKVFNCFIQKPVRPWLNRNWAAIISNGYVDKEPSDDPKLSLSFSEAILEFCKYFAQPGSLFLFKGTNDYSALVTNFRRHHQLNQPKIEEAIHLFQERQYRFIRVDPAFTKSSLPISLGKDTAKKLNALFKNMFVDSLLFNTEAAGLLYSMETEERINKKLKLVDPSFPKRAFPTKAENKVELWYWANNYLEPVWHYAHTDSLHTRNCLLAVALYKQLLEPNDLDPLKIWKELMTKIVVVTVAFRKTHLGCSAEMANWIVHMINRDKTAFRNSRYLPVHIFNQLKQLENPEAEQQPKQRNFRKTEFRLPIWLSPDKEESSLREFTKSNLTGSLLIESKNSSEQALQVYKNVKIQPDKRNNASMLKEVLKQIVLFNGQRLEGDGCRLPDWMILNKSDFHNFIEFLKKLNRMQLHDQAYYNNYPCFVVMNSNSSERFPKTYLLHHIKCSIITLEGTNAAPKTASQQSVNVIDFRKKPLYSYRFRFCKRCKKYETTEPFQLDVWPEQTEYTAPTQVLSQFQSQPQPQIIVQPAPVIIQGGGGGRNPIQRPQPPDSRKPLVGQPFIRKKNLFIAQGNQLT